MNYDGFGEAMDLVKQARTLVDVATGLIEQAKPATQLTGEQFTHALGSSESLIDASNAMGNLYASFRADERSPE